MRTILTTLVMTLAGLAQGQEAAPPAEDLTQAFQREYIYLSSQKEALKNQKSLVEKNLGQRIQAAKNQTQALQKNLVTLSSQNDESHEYLMNLERRKKDLQKKSSSLESTYKKAQKSLNELEGELRFTPAVGKTADAVAGEDLKFEDFEGMMSKASQLLESAEKIETYSGSFLDLNDELVEGTITRIGRSAAIGSLGDQHFVLGPNGEGLMKALEASTGPHQASMSLYIFDSLSKASKIKKTGGFVEKLADLSPLLFLSVILLLVAGLFSALIKV